MLHESQVDASATLELLMVSFDNPGGKKADGDDCDVFNGRCDHVFQFSLDRGDRSRQIYFTILNVCFNE